MIVQTARSILSKNYPERLCSPNFVRNGPPSREDNAEQRQALVARMQTAAAKTPATQGGVTE